MSYLNPQAVADRLGISKRTLSTLIKTGKAPPHFRVGNQLRWRKEEVDNWVKEAITAASPTQQIG